jgi:hypothetical protein
MKIYHVIPVAVALLLSVGLPAHAESMHPQMDSKHTIILGVYHQKADTDFFANPDGIDKTEINFGDLGVEDTDNSVMLEYRYRLNEKWVFAVGTYQFDTTGKTSAKRDFTYDGVEFEAGAHLDTELDVDTYMIEALYSVYKSDRALIMLGAGLHLIDFSVSIDAKVAVDDLEGSGSRSANDILAPLPNLRLQGFYAFSSKWALTATVGWLSLNYEDYDGSFSYVHARTTYRLTERFGAGIGYQYLDMELTHDRQRGEAGFDIQFTGPAAYLSYSF